ncbi:Apoptosis regulator [Dirofilaria immitis]
MFISDSTTSKYDKYNEYTNVWFECRDDIYVIQDFVADYIQYRLRIHSNRRIPNLMHACRRSYQNDLMRSVALIFEEKHEEELRRMVASLCANENFSFKRYIEIMEHFVCIQNEKPAEMSYGRLIALIAFAGLIATRLSDMKRFAEVSMIMSYTSKFLQKRVALTWPQNKRSWSKFFDLARTIVKLNKNEESEPKIERNEWWSAISRMAFFSVLSIAVFTLFKFMLRAR